MLEQWGQHDSPRLLDTDLDAPPEQQYDLLKHDSGHRLVSQSGRVMASSKMNQDLPYSEASHPTLPLRSCPRNRAKINRNDVPDSSIQALCLLQISHVKQERWLLRSSLTLHDRALQALQGALAQPTNSFKAEIFAAARALAIYEMLQGTNAGKSHGWMYHIEGASSYLNAYPRLDVSYFIHQMSFHFRETICIFDVLKPEIYSISPHPGSGDGFLTDLGPYLWSTIAHNNLSSENTSSVQ